MNTILHKFITEPLFDATEAMLSHLHIRFTAQSKTPLSFQELYTDTTSSTMPQALKKVIEKINNTYLIGAIDEDTLEGRQSDFDIEKPLDGKYQTMLVFAVDIKHVQSLTRSELATLTRGFNRMAPQLPVVVFVKNGDFLSLATCERSEYRQDWREGEKLGKVSILRDINCVHPHRGHIDILSSIGDKAYPTFDELYKHWLTVFSSELLTKKFYTELSEWYAWVIGSGKVKFPNDISTTEDDSKFNHEAVIRLITRLIFVWFLKQKNLIPEDFFNEKAIRDKFIENFDPHSTNTLFYNPEESKYYRLILQNLFFAMLNRPIMDEESGNDENRRFVTSKRIKGVSPDYNINNLLRYRSEFKEGGADELLELANSQVPFLNGGLFECLDDKDNGMYYDGFSERKASLEQLAFPDYFFFGEEVGHDVDLSKWYDDKKKSHVHVRGLINILRSYNFTVEENTPLDQEVSLDPELLGKAFENLLASYNPETHTTARKQTGSFYTPRDIVKYMVDESLIAHLKRSCPSLDESTFRTLFDYSVENFDIPEEDRKVIMSALYNCKVLDPACGSGAFPMGVLQQMVHALRKLDPTNEMWREFILEMSLKKDKEAYQVADEEERKRLRIDIEQSFNRQVNDPDYARKLYLIENCIYGVDIQPIATQISKLRFFISLVAEQKPTHKASKNFGIRPLPNLEAKIVAANSLIPLGEGNIFTNTEEISNIKKRLAEANHKLFIAKRNADKRKIREQIVSIRNDYANELIAVGAIDDDDAMKLAKWNMFEQNEFAKFFEPQWMFGISEGFDVIIANPPYVSIKDIPSDIVKIYKSNYDSAKKQTDLYAIFLEKAIALSKKGGTICFIVPDSLIDRSNFEPIRSKILKDNGIISLLTLNKVFESATVGSSIIIFSKASSFPQVKLLQTEDKVTFANNDIKTQLIPQQLFESNESKAFLFLSEKETALIQRLMKSGIALEYFSEFMGRGEEIGRNADVISYESGRNKLSFVNGSHVSRYSILDSELYIDKVNVEKDLSKYYSSPKIFVRQVGTSINATIDVDNCVCPQSIYIIRLSDEKECKYVLGLLNSKLFNFIYQKKFNTKKLFPRILLENLKVLPIKVDKRFYKTLIQYVDEIYAQPTGLTEIKIDLAVFRIYGLSYEEVLIVDPETSITEEEYNSHE